MPVTGLHLFKTRSGGRSRHMEITLEARERLQRLGLQAMCVQPIMGSDVGALGTVIQYENYSDWAHSSERVWSDRGWQDFYSRAAAEGVADEIEATLMGDVDPAYQIDANRPMAVIRAAQWRPLEGRAAGLLDNIANAVPHLKRLGAASVRVMQCIDGAHPMTMMVSTSFASMDQLGEHLDRLADDEQWNVFWSAVLKKPTASLVRSGTYKRIE